MVNKKRFQEIMHNIRPEKLKQYGIKVASSYDENMDECYKISIMDEDTEIKNVLLNKSSESDKQIETIKNVHAFYNAFIDALMSFVTYSFTEKPEDKKKFLDIKVPSEESYLMYEISGTCKSLIGTLFTEMPDSSKHLVVKNNFKEPAEENTTKYSVNGNFKRTLNYGFTDHEIPLETIELVFDQVSRVNNLEFGYSKTEIDRTSSSGSMEEENEETTETTEEDSTETSIYPKDLEYVNVFNISVTTLIDYSISKVGGVVIENPDILNEKHDGFGKITIEI